MDPRAGGHGQFRLVGGAWVHEQAVLAEGVVLEPGAVVGGGAVVGPRCWIGPHAVVYGPSVLGEENQVYPGAVLGGPPQDVGYRGEPTRLEIGKGNVFREGVTVSRGSAKGTGVTKIGDRNYFMANAHVGHDCVVEDDCVFANGAQISGHCHVQSHANLSGATGVVQFTTIGRYAFLGGMAGTRQDLEPFIIHDRTKGEPHSRPIAVNVVGLRRGGFSEETIRKLREAFKVLFIKGPPDPDLALDEIERRGARCPEVDELLEFLRRKRRGRFGRQLERLRT